MFRGINSATLDGKGRMALPTRFRESLMAVSEGRIVVTIDTAEKCLLLYPISEWEIVQRKLESLPNMVDNARRMQRILIGHATDIEIDGQGRILLPGMLRDYAALEKKLVLVGQGNKLEIWAADHWQSRMDDWLSDGSTLVTDADQFIGLSV